MDYKKLFNVININSINESLYPLLSWLRTNPYERNLILFGTNVIFVFLLIFQFNVGNIFNMGYEGASKIAPWLEEDVSKISIIDPELKKNNIKEIELLRQDILRELPSKKSSWFSSLFSSKQKHYNWNLNLVTLSTPSLVNSSKNSSKDSIIPPSSLAFVEADVERVSELFQSLQEVRRYYAIPRTKEKESSSGMLVDTNGNYIGLHLVFYFTNNKKQTLYIGSSTKKADESFVRLNDEKEIYIAKTNIRLKSGVGDESYFRNKKLWPKEIDLTSLSGLTVQIKNNNQPLLQLNKLGTEWSMPFPPSTSKLKQASIQTFLQDIVSWQVTSFLKVIPKDLDPKFPSLEVNVRYRDKNNSSQENNFNMSILGRKGASEYVCLLPDQSIRQIASSVLEQIIDPVKNFSEPTNPIKK